ncbi:MAG TPA: glycosyl transferase family 90 [Rhizomicrobium sp.]|jgi:hypothetical protein
MTQAAAIITADSTPDPAALLADDLAYHLGDRDTYELGAMASAVTQAPAPDSAFLCIQRDRGILAGDDYKERCRLTETGIVIDADVDGKQRRTVVVINRDFSLLGDAIPYAYEMRDGRKYDYVAIFGTAKPIPVFQYHRRRGCAAIIHTLPGFHTFPSRHIPRLDDTTPFEEKVPKVFWRGQRSGRIESPNGYVGSSRVLADPSYSEAEKRALLRQMPRIVFCEASSGKEFLDVALVPAKTDSPDDPLLQHLYRPRVPREEQLTYRYLLALDGNDAPSSWFWMLNTNSVVLRQESPWEIFADNYFRPWIHFVPVARDASDLTEKFLWCEQHLSECARISANARRAWSVLFDRKYQATRREALLAAYRSWFA